jgi:hypothetical protein
MIAGRIRRCAMSVRIMTAREMKGSKWGKEFPDKADELWVIARVGGKRKKKHIGPPTSENRARAERKRDEWLLILEKKTRTHLINPSVARHPPSARSLRCEISP